MLEAFQLLDQMFVFLQYPVQILLWYKENILSINESKPQHQLPVEVGNIPEDH